jgi:hypothetical protein
MMQDISPDHKEAMGQLHNEIVVLVDASILSPPEIILLLGMLTEEIQRAFETAVRGGE